jgi:hypothetical protein
MLLAAKDAVAGFTDAMPNTVGLVRRNRLRRIWFASSGA